MTNWLRYEELRPDGLAEIVAEAPVAYWPLGLLEHHGWPWGGRRRPPGRTPRKPGQ